MSAYANLLKRTHYRSCYDFLEYVEEYWSDLLGWLDLPERSTVGRYDQDLDGAILWDFSDIDRATGRRGVPQ